MKNGRPLIAADDDMRESTTKVETPACEPYGGNLRPVNQQVHPHARPYHSGLGRVCFVTELETIQELFLASLSVAKLRQCSHSLGR